MISRLVAFVVAFFFAFVGIASAQEQIVYRGAVWGHSLECTMKGCNVDGAVVDSARSRAPVQPTKPAAIVGRLFNRHGETKPGFVVLQSLVNEEIMDVGFVFTQSGTFVLDFVFQFTDQGLVTAPVPDGTYRVLGFVNGHFANHGRFVDVRGPGSYLSDVEVRPRKTDLTNAKGQIVHGGWVYWRFDFETHVAGKASLRATWTDDRFMNNQADVGTWDIHPGVRVLDGWHQLPSDAQKGKRHCLFLEFADSEGPNFQAGVCPLYELKR